LAGFGLAATIFAAGAIVALVVEFIRHNHAEST
jgi:hypothetical protein